MTTNKEEAIPPELYRPGRIDREITFRKLPTEQCKIFADSFCDILCSSLGIPFVERETVYYAPHSHAEVTGVVTEEVKHSYLTGGTKNE